MITGVSKQRDAHEAYAAGANIFLVKPFRPETLCSYAKLLMGVA